MCVCPPVSDTRQVGWKTRNTVLSLGRRCVITEATLVPSLSGVGGLVVFQLFLCAKRPLTMRALICMV